MKVLVACEYSGTVRNAFIRAGHDAMSCDLLPTQKPASGRWENQTPSGQNKLGPSADRWSIRSTTYAGIAQAMADQWSQK
jgi:hypothetical protein